MPPSAVRALYAEVCQTSTTNVCRFVLRVDSRYGRRTIEGVERTQSFVNAKSNVCLPAVISRVISLSLLYLAGSVSGNST